MRSYITAISYTIILATCFTTQTTSAAENCAPSHDRCIEIGQLNLELAVGLGAKTNPIEDSDPIPLIFVPQISYYGERFFMENLDLGYTLFESVNHSINLIATPDYDRVYFHRNSLQNIFMGNTLKAREGTEESLIMDEQPSAHSSRDRNITYLAGLDWTYGLDHFSMQLSYLHEITGEHHGNEFRFATAVPLVQDLWVLSATIGATWKSAEAVDYYYGEKGIYSPSSAVNPFLKLGYETQLNNKWSLKIFGHYERLDNEIVNSPIVSKNEVLSLFIGGIYSF
ncbi:MAG: MipA/OmpV family protein [Exilibacterium sp.]